MLSDRERLKLNDIERELGENDPELAQRLSQESPPDRLLWRYWLASAVACMLLLICIGADAPIAALVFLMVIVGTGTAGYLHHRKRRSN